MNDEHDRSAGPARAAGTLIAGTFVTVVGTARATGLPARVRGVLALADAAKLVVHIADPTAAPTLDRAGSVALITPTGLRHESNVIHMNDRWVTLGRPGSLEVDDGRATGRAPVDMVPAHIELDGDSLAAFVVDVSPRGLRLLLAHDERLRTGVELSIRIEDGSGTAEVRHAARTPGADVMHVGLQVRSADAPLRSQLLHLTGAGRASLYRD